MSVDTKGRLLGHVPAVKVLEYIKSHIDSNAAMDVSEKKYPISEGWKKIIKKYYGTNSGYITEVSGFINFHEDGGAGMERSLFYFYIDINTYEDYECYCREGLKDMVESETTYINLGCFGDSVKIIKDLVSHFGGWIDENDCDEQPFYKVDVDNIV